MRRRSFREQYGDPDAILTGDWHIREDTPISRIDDFLVTQKKKLLFLKKMQKAFDCPVIHSGDVFHYWKVNPFLIAFALTYFPKQIVGVYGNHDLPRHSYRLRIESALYALQKANIFEERGLSYGLRIEDFEDEGYCLYLGGKRILIWHVFTYQAKRKTWYGEKVLSARAILKKFSNFDLIVTGDNHQSFVEEYEGRLLVNPGCLVRGNISEKDYEPTVYLWYARENKVVPVVIPHQKDDLIDHRISSEEKNDRTAAFIERIEKLGDSISVDFRRNLDIYFSKNKVSKLVEEIVYKSIEEVR